MHATFNWSCIVFRCSVGARSYSYICMWHSCGVSGWSWIFSLGCQIFMKYISNSFKNFSILSTSAVVNLFEYNIGYAVQVLMRTYRKTGGCSGTWGLWRDPPLCGVSLHVCRLCIMKSCMWNVFVAATISESCISSWTNSQKIIRVMLTNI